MQKSYFKQKYEIQCIGCIVSKYSRYFGANYEIYFIIIVTIDLLMTRKRSLRAISQYWTTAVALRQAADSNITL